MPREMVRYANRFSPVQMSPKQSISVRNAPFSAAVRFTHPTDHGLPRQLGRHGGFQRGFSGFQTLTKDGATIHKDAQWFPAQASAGFQPIGLGPQRNLAGTAARA